MKEKTGYWLSGKNKASYFFLYLLVLFLPTQLGKHFWPQSSFVYGLRIDYLSPTIYLTDIFIFLIFIFSAKNIFEKLIKNHLQKTLYLSIFVFFLALGIYVSKNPLAGLYGILKLLEYLFLGLFLYFNFKKTDKSKIAVLIGIGVLLESFLSLMQYINQGSLDGIFYLLGERSFSAQTPGIANASLNGELILRPYGTFSHPNTLAGYLTLSMIFILSFRKALNTYFVFLVLTCGSFAVFLSLSRTAILGWLLFLFIFFLFTIFEKYKKSKINPRVFIHKKILALSFLIILFFYFLNPFALQRFTSLRMTDESIVQRQYLINQSLEMIIKNPILGVGINNFLNNLKVEPDNLVIQPVHNIFLLTFSQTGIIGLAFLIFTFFKALLISIGNKNIFKLGIVFSLIFLGLFDHYFLTIQQGQIMLVFFLTYCLYKQT